MAKYTIGPRTFINPYNFISLNEEGCLRGESRRDDKTGYIECILTTKTPTFIPDSKEITPNSYTYRFFNYTEKINEFLPPVIPGSELRGMIRSDYEIFTDSCLANMNIDKHFLGRTNTPRKPGLIKKDENGNWHLYRAKRYALLTMPDRNKNYSGIKAYKVDKDGFLYTKNNKLRTSNLVSFDYITKKGRNKMDLFYVSELNDLGERKGYLLIGEYGRNKEYDHIFVDTNEEIKVNRIQDGFQGLLETIEAYQNPSINKAKGRCWYKNYYHKNDKVVPVWYRVNDDGVSFSPAAIGKAAYNQTVKNLITVNQKQNFMPCVNKKQLCKACDLFGFISDSDSQGSRIRVSDAVLKNMSVNPYGEEVILKELASPKTSNAAFYLNYYSNDVLGKKCDYWTYDTEYFDNRSALVDSNRITIRGRKVYWHHKPNENWSYQDDLNERNIKVTPVKEDVEFTFRIYFENISIDQLQELVSVLELKSTTKKNLYHKIGHGKPLGLGSVDIKINEIKVRNIDLNADVPYQMVDMNLGNTLLENIFDMNTIPMKEALRIYDFDYISIEYPDSIVSYPYGDNGKNNLTSRGTLQWFRMNSEGESVKRPMFTIVLPKILDGDVTINRKSNEFVLHGQAIPEFVVKK